MVMKNSGFSLIEIILYVAILGVVVGLFSGILGVATRVQVRESAATEVSSQINFVTQTIQRLIRESSATLVNCSIDEISKDNDSIENLSECDPAFSFLYTGSLLGTSTPVLRLRMKDSCNSSVDCPSNPNPTADRVTVVIWKDPSTGTIKMRERNGLTGETTSDLTTSKVKNTNNELTFTKYANYPGHDVIQINLTLNYNSTNPQSQIVKKIETAVGRVSAATFDSALLPGTGTLGIGQITQTWKDLFLSGNYSIIDGKVSEPENYGVSGGITRGYQILFTLSPTGIGFFPPGEIARTCQDVCSDHGLGCLASLKWPSLGNTDCTAAGPDTGYFCICK